MTVKIVILAGGYGTRLSEETDLKPKPLVEIGGKPILWHIMKLYSTFGFDDFVVCCGYKGEMIKRYFLDYNAVRSDITVNLRDNSIEYISGHSENWRVTLVDTGLDTMTGGRIERIKDHIGDTTFGLTYGDGLCDVHLADVLQFHRAHGKAATVTAVPARGRFGILDLADEDRVERFHEKPETDMGWINGGFFFLEPTVFDYLDGDATTWEREPLERLAAEDQLRAFRHYGFWKAMDTLREKRELEAIWTERGSWSTP